MFCIENTALTALGSVFEAKYLFCFVVVPINALLVSTFSLRICSGVGSVLAIAGVLSSAFAFKLWFLIVGFSLFAGNHYIYSLAHLVLYIFSLTLVK